MYFCIVTDILHPVFLFSLKEKSVTENMLGIHHFICFNLTYDPKSLLSANRYIHDPLAKMSSYALE